MEGVPVVALLVCDVVHRRGHVVDGDEVRVAELEADQREPLREGVPQLLDRLEEVVGTVDLVHLAGLRVADHDRRPVHPPGALHPLADELLGLELRPVVGMGELLALVEGVLGEVALVLARHRDRGGVVEVAGPDLVGEVDGVLRAVDVEPPVALLVVGGHVVDRRQVEEVVDALERLAVLLGDAEVRLGEVAGDRPDAVGARAAVLAQPLELLLGPLPDQDVDVAVALEQALDEMAADESGRSRHEVAHPFVSPSAVSVRGAGIYLDVSAPGPARARSSRPRTGTARRRAA